MSGENISGIGSKVNSPCISICNGPLTDSKEGVRDRLINLKREHHKNGKELIEVTITWDEHAQLMNECNWRELKVSPAIGKPLEFMGLIVNIR